MKQFIVKYQKAAGAIAICFVFGLIMLSFADTPYVSQILNEQPQPKDTVPLKKEKDKMTMKEFDRLSGHLDQDMLKVAEEMKKINLDEIQKEVERSLKEVDIDKIMKEVSQSLKEVDIEKITAEVTASLKEVDWDKKSNEIKEALEQAKTELEKAKTELKQMNEKEIKKELENAKAELDKTKEQLKNIDMDKIMSEAKEEIAGAKKELQQLKTMFTEMENDGLIKTKEGFKIEYKDKELFINDKKQSKEVTDKYRKYFKDEHFEIEIEKDQQ